MLVQDERGAALGVADAFAAAAAVVRFDRHPVLVGHGPILHVTGRPRTCRTSRLHVVEERDGWTWWMDVVDERGR